MAPLVAVLPWAVWAVESPPDSGPSVEQLRQLRLEDILNTEITSVSKRPEKLFEAPAAAFVITGEEVHRSGATSLPEALRLAPGVSVAQVDGSAWAVGARGFNDQFTDRLLVLMDGRSVYSPITSGVFWNVQDTLLEDLDRIEVVRGPGGTLWGANAVNGVVNILTKSAKDTQGLYTTAGGGTEERAFGAARYGFQVSENGYARAYVKYTDRAAHPTAYDDWDHAQGGFRSDWDSGENHITVQGDYYAQDRHLRITIPTFPPAGSYVSPETFSTEGGNALFRFERRFSEESELKVQAYYDRFDEFSLASRKVQEVFDVDLQHRFPWVGGQNVMYGVGYRYLPNNLQPDAISRYDPQVRHEQLFSSFVQDEIGVWQDQVRVTLGTKVEYNGFTGWEVQPNARLAWLPSANQTVWGAVSRAVQVPGRNFNDSQTTLPPFPNVPLLVVGTGSTDVLAQETLAYELGYRIKPLDRLSFDLASFYNVYDRITTGSTEPPVFSPTPYPHLVGTGVENGGSGTSYGFEVAVEYRLTEWWRLAGTYSFLKMDLTDAARSLYSPDKDPRNQASLRSSFNLPAHFEFDAWGRFVDHLTFFPNVPAYFDLDLRLAWKPTKHLELAVVGQNLLAPQRYEFGPNQFVVEQASPVPRGGYVQVSYHF